MPAEFSKGEVARIAALANLELRDDEIALFARQLGEILDYANQLQQIDTTGVPPTESVIGARVVDRSDTLVPCLDRDLALANAPDGAPDAGLFRVPRVIG